MPRRHLRSVRLLSSLLRTQRARRQICKLPPARPAETEAQDEKEDKQSGGQVSMTVEFPTGLGVRAMASARQPHRC